jgi:hypothetical protein
MGISGQKLRVAPGRQPAQRAQKSIPQNARTKLPTPRDTVLKQIAALKQESNSENLCTGKPWSHEPGAYPVLDAAIEARADRGGAVWSPHLLALDFLTFGAFLNLSEVVEFFGKLFPVGSDQAHSLTWLRERADQFTGSRGESRARLTALTYESPLYEERGFRHVQNAFGSIFDGYDGLLAKQKRNAKLRDAPGRRVKTHSAYAERERARKAQRRWAQK